MIQSITLQNFRSFGVKQTVPLEAMSVLVGPNDSGKSCFLSVGALFREFAVGNLTTQYVYEVMMRAGGAKNLLFRPPTGDGTLQIAWKSDIGEYATTLQKNNTPGSAIEFETLSEVLENAQGKQAPFGLGGLGFPATPSDHFIRLRWAHHNAPEFRPITRALIESREVRLYVPAIRADAPFAETPKLGRDGSHTASVLSYWRSAFPEKAEELEDFLRKCIPGFRHVLSMPAPAGAADEPHYRLWFQQTNGERFEAKYSSDGLLVFTALAMHAVEAEPGSVIFIEEPEHFLHPLRLHEIVELFRRVYTSKKCQFVIATHSPIFLNEFRDEPESILLFRRGPEGTLVTPLSERPELVDALHTNMPGDLLAGGFFNDPAYDPICCASTQPLFDSKPDPKLGLRLDTQVSA